MKHTSIELSKRLKELGLDDGTSEYVWVEDYDRPMTRGESIHHEHKIIAPAYQFHEVMRYLPSHIEGFDLIMRKGDNDKLIVGFSRFYNLNNTLFVEAHESPVEAIGLLLEWERSRG